MSGTPPEFDNAVPLGSDELGTTYRARDRRRGITVAVTMLPLTIRERAVRRRWRTDLQTAAALNGHPHVVALHDVDFTREHRPYLVTAVPPPESLAARLARTGPLPVGQAARLGRDIADALISAHQHNVLHLDLRPQTIHVDSGERAVVRNFGVLPAIRHLHPDAVPASGMVHAPRELLSPEPPGPAADAYALASVLFELLTGHPAHAVEAALGRPALHQRLLRTDPPPLPRPDVPSALRDLLAATLVPDPTRRPPLPQTRALLATLATDPWSLAPPHAAPTPPMTTAAIPTDRTPPPPAPPPPAPPPAAPPPAETLAPPSLLSAPAPAHAVSADLGSPQTTTHNLAIVTGPTTPGRVPTTGQPQPRHYPDPPTAPPVPPADTGPTVLDAIAAAVPSPQPPPSRPAPQPPSAGDDAETPADPLPTVPHRTAHPPKSPAERLATLTTLSRPPTRGRGPTGTAPAAAATGSDTAPLPAGAPQAAAVPPPGPVPPWSSVPASLVRAPGDEGRDPDGRDRGWDLPGDGAGPN